MDVNKQKQSPTATLSVYSGVLKYRNSITQNDNIQNKTRNLSQMQKNCQQETFLRISSSSQKCLLENSTTHIQESWK